MPEITALDFRNALFTAFDAFWADRTQIAAPNVHFDPAAVPADETAWVRLYLLGDDEGQTRLSGSIARSVFSESGRLTFEVYVRENADLDQAYTLAQDFLDWISAGSNMAAVPGAVFRECSPPQEVGPDGVWFQVSVTCSWFYLTDRAA